MCNLGWPWGINGAHVNGVDTTIYEGGLTDQCKFVVSLGATDSLGSGKLNPTLARGDGQLRMLS